MYYYIHCGSCWWSYYLPRIVLRIQRSILFILSNTTHVCFQLTNAWYMIVFRHIFLWLLVDFFSTETYSSYYTSKILYRYDLNLRFGDLMQMTVFSEVVAIIWTNTFFFILTFDLARVSLKPPRYNVPILITVYAVRVALMSDDIMHLRVIRGTYGINKGCILHWITWIIIKTTTPIQINCPCIKMWSTITMWKR